ncbi:MAG: PAS domain-containing protein [Chloroflexi bacterium]|nr:PAS domain-containing protein [Chloroflexota bacterium]
MRYQPRNPVVAPSLCDVAWLLSWHFALNRFIAGLGRGSQLLSSELRGAAAPRAEGTRDALALAWRAGTLRWVLGAYCVLLGALLLVVPHQLGSQLDVALVIGRSWYGLGLLLAGLGLHYVGIAAPGRALTVAAHFVAGALLLQLAVSLGAGGVQAGAAVFAVFALGLLLAGWLPPSRGTGAPVRGDLFVLLMGVAVAVDGLVLLLQPRWTVMPFGTPAQAQWWLGLACMAGGLALCWIQLRRSVPWPVAAAAHVLVAVLLMLHLAIVVPAPSAWTEAAFYGGFGTVLGLLPWFGPRLARIDPTSLRTRLALALSLTAALPLLTGMALHADFEQRTHTGAALSELHGELNLSFVLLVVVVGGMAIVGATVAGYLSRPLSVLTRATEAFTAGHQSVLLPRSHIAEVARLARAFDDMRDRLAARTAERERAEAEVRALNAELEQRVAERTAQLEAAVRDLTNEIVERERARQERMELLARERAARAEAEKLAAERSAILDHIAEGVIIASPTGEIVFVNAAARRIHGISEPDASLARRAGPYRLLTPAGEPHPPGELPLERAARRGQTVLEHEMQVQRADGSRVVVAANAAPVLGDDGVRLGAVLTMRDVTVHREVERQKDEFFANVSHDLRTPVAGIKASIGVVLANEPPGTPEPLHRMFVNIDLAAERLSRLVGDLLELTRLQARRVQPRLEDCDLRALALRCVRSVEPLAETRRQRVEVTVPARPILATADPGRLERALLNLLENAHKYGYAGGVIRLSLLEAPGEVFISVSDDGPGIPEAEQDRIFERFYRPESSTSSRNDGSGLGLPIARAMIELQRGRLWLESAPGQGATFWIALPASPEAEAAPSRRSDVPPSD